MYSITLSSGETKIRNFFSITRRGGAGFNVTITDAECTS